MAAPAMRSKKTPSLRAFVLAVTFVILIFLMGGASRADVLSLVPLRLLSIVVGAAAILFFKPEDRAPAAPLWFLASLAAIMCIQLVPLPYSWWSNFPGRSLVVTIDGAAGIAPIWRTISLTPDYTVNALLATVPPLAMVIMISRLPRSQLPAVCAVLILMVISSGLFGIIQRVSGTDAFYPYSITSYGQAVGWLANRNHNAMALAAGITLLPTLFALPRFSSRVPKWFLPALSIVGTIMFLSIMVTGSRAGMAIGTIGAAYSVLVIGARIRRNSGPEKENLWRYIAVAMGVVSLIVLLAVNSEAGQRLFADGLSNEQRVRLAKPLINIALHYFPAGTGFGSFPDVFRVHEPLGNLSSEYLNHAHNDYIEWVIEGGLFAVVAAIIFAGWAASKAYRSWRADIAESEVLMARAAAGVIGVFALGSLSDYPLRTPLCASLVVIAIFLLAGRAKSRNALPNDLRAIRGSQQSGSRAQ